MDALDSVHIKVNAIFVELAGESARELEGGHYAAGINTDITVALSAGTQRTEEELLRFDEIDSIW